MAYRPALFTIISVPRQKNSCHKDLCSKVTMICSALTGKQLVWFNCSTFPVLRSTLQHPNGRPLGLTSDGSGCLLFRFGPHNRCRAWRFVGLQLRLLAGDNGDHFNCGRYLHRFCCFALSLSLHNAILIT